MKQKCSRAFAFAAMLISTSTGFAATTTLDTTLPAPNIYYTGLANSQKPNYLVTNLTFGAGIISYFPGGDIGADLLPYLDITAKDTFSYDAKSCIRYNPCSYFKGSATDSVATSNYPNVFQAGDQLDANYHFTLFQPQNLSFAVTTRNGSGAYTLQLRDSANQLVTPDNAGIYALTGSSYTLELNTTFDSINKYMSIIGTPVAAPVPVPAALWLFGSGLLGLAGVSRKRKAS